MRTPGAALAVGSLLLLAAAPAANAEPVRPGEEPTFDLGILPPSTPDLLKAVAAAPYVAPVGSDCEGIAREIATLDEVLGPDADAPKASGVNTGRIVGQAVKSLIPYRSVARFVTGADRKQRERDHAAMAGWARRGYLKGIQASQHCPGATAAPMIAANSAAPHITPAPHLVPADVTGADTSVLAPGAAPSPRAVDSASPVRVGRVGQPDATKIETSFSR